MKRFVLDRLIDISEVSGTGIVAEGVKGSNGKIVLMWGTRERPSVTIWDSIEHLMSVHGHGGKTRIVWLDDMTFDAAHCVDCHMLDAICSDHKQVGSCPGCLASVI